MNKVVWPLLAMLGLSAIPAHAGVSAEEAAQLGKTLNPMGGEMAGNKEGTIPAWTGGYRAPISTMGTKRWTDPFASDKPRLVITAENYTQHADKLMEFQKELFRRHKNYRLDVYPTRRSAWIPDWVAENTAKNATAGKIAADGLTPQDVFGGIPFPIPKTGIEAWWNHELRYRAGVFHIYNANAYMVDASGRSSLNSAFLPYLYFPYYDRQLGRDGFLKGDQLYYKVYVEYAAPASRVGETSLFWTWMDNKKYTAKGWQYTPGTRRVRTTPDLFYDTPNPGYNGGITMDDNTMTYGPQDRFDWKLLGKREVYIPYNNYSQTFKTSSKDLLTPYFPNPDHMRMELHRVWVLEGKPKPGVRHIYSKKVLYMDEDNLTTNMETYDQAGKIYRAGLAAGTQMYDTGVQYDYGGWYFDLSTGAYWASNHSGDANVKGAVFFPKDDNDQSWRKTYLPMFTPEYLQANGIR